MVISYTKTRTGNYLINTIEDVLTWGEIEERYGLEVKVCYLTSFPFISCNDDTKLSLFRKTSIPIYLEIGEEYDEEYFYMVKDIILESDKRLRDIVNYVEEEEFWDSTLNPLY